jgi:hypothetical protein
MVKVNAQYALAGVGCSYWLSTPFSEIRRANRGHYSDQPLEVEGKLLSSHALVKWWAPGAVGRQIPLRSTPGGDSSNLSQTHGRGIQPRGRTL